MSLLCPQPQLREELPAQTLYLFPNPSAIAFEAAEDGWGWIAREHLHTHLFPRQQPLGCVLCSGCELQFQLLSELSVTVLRAQLQEQVEKFIIKNAHSKWILLGTVQLQTAVASVHL